MIYLSVKAVVLNNTLVNEGAIVAINNKLVEQKNKQDDHMDNGDSIQILGIESVILNDFENGGKVG